MGASVNRLRGERVNRSRNNLVRSGAPPSSSAPPWTDDVIWAPDSVSGARAAAPRVDGSKNGDKRSAAGSGSARLAASPTDQSEQSSTVREAVDLPSVRATAAHRAGVFSSRPRHGWAVRMDRELRCGFGDLALDEKCDRMTATSMTTRSGLSDRSAVWPVAPKVSRR
jgi:hypothetical protein